MLTPRWSALVCCLALASLALVATAGPLLAQDPPSAGETKAPEATVAETPAAEPSAAPAPPPPLTPADLKVMVDTVWVMIAGFLVFFMNLGFACVESGFCRSKNAVNILSKNFIVFSATTLGFWLVGWGLMFGNPASPESELGKYIGETGLWTVSGADNSPAIGPDYKGDYGAISWPGVPLMAKFFFQLVFAGTAATIVSGAVAERIKYISFILFSFIMAIAIYPVVGHWIWGGGWLAQRGFVDFAGSTVVHSVGGWAALAGVYILGPRIGKYSADGKINAIPGHNLTVAVIGCMILWFGWFGFNPGSTMGVDAAAISEIAVTTNAAAAGGSLAATAVAWIVLGKPDLGMTLNGCLAGLVAITAPCAFVTVPVATLIGVIGGTLVVFGVLFFDKIRADDPVGATSVHLLNGVFGTLCVGLFATPDRIARSGNTEQKAGLFYGAGSEQFFDQLIGVIAAGAYVVVVAALAWIILKATVGIRVTAEEEHEGLDVAEHGNNAYYGFGSMQ